MQYRFALLCFNLCVLVASTRAVEGGLVETWESPALAAGSMTTALPGPWVRFSGTPDDSQVWHPDSTTRFNQVDPLASPAGGDQLLFLNGVNVGISRMSGVTIGANTTYDLSAAIGDDKLTENNQFWSLQLWADANGNGHFDGSSGDVFIGQQFGTNAGAINPSSGDWALNSFSFDSLSVPDLVGLQLIVFLNNYGDGVSYYDNVSLQAGTVPEPSSLAILGIGSFGIVVVRSARGLKAQADRRR